MLPPKEDLKHFPAPYEEITGLKVHHPHWGPGWLGFHVDVYDEGEVTTIYFLRRGEGEVPVEVHHDHIFTFNDTWTGYTWLIFALEGEQPTLFPFVLNPRPGFYPRAMHPRLRAFLRE